MLPNHSALRVAEQFKVLSALIPGRIDLGIGRAPGTDQMTAFALRRSREAMAADDFPEQLGELLAFAGEKAVAGRPPVHATSARRPSTSTLPPIYLLGSSEFSAQLAASAGLGFAFAAHINPEMAVDALRLYRERFEPSPRLAEPYAILAHAVVCADDDERAWELAAPARVAFRRLRAGRPTPAADASRTRSPRRARVPPRKPGRAERMIVGSPVTIRDRADELLSLSGADELMAMTNVHDLADRLRSLELVAEAFRPGPRGRLEPSSAYTSRRKRRIVLAEGPSE